MARNPIDIGAIGGIRGLPSFSSVFGGDKRKPFVYPDLPKVDQDTGYDFFSRGADYASRIGRDRLSSYLTNRAGKYTSDTPYASPYANPDGTTNWESLGPGGASHDAISAINRGWRERLTRAGQAGVDFNWDTLMNRNRLGLSSDIEGAMKQGLIAEIDPSLKTAQEAADANLNTAAIDAGAESAIRSRFVAGAKQDAATRLARISAGLGLGNTTNSPAAAALAQSDATSMDSAVTSGLRDLSVQASQVNKQQHAQDIELAAKIAAARFNILNGDSKSIIGMQGDVTSMIDALYSRDQTMRLQQEALNAAGKGSGFAGALGGATSGATAGASIGGPWGAAVGGAAGAGLGYLGSR